MLFEELGLNSTLCKWTFNFLTGRPLAVHFESYTSSLLIIDTGTGAPQGCVPSPLLYFLSIFNLSDDTGRPDPLECRESLTGGTWRNGARRTTSLWMSAEWRNSRWTLRRSKRGITSPQDQWGPVERVDSFRYSCSPMFILWLRKLISFLNTLNAWKGFRLLLKVVKCFYIYTKESVMTGSITAGDAVSKMYNTNEDIQTESFFF